MDCGREPNGKNVSQYGVCQVATETTLNGVHNGKNGGRCCWIIVEYAASNSEYPFCTGKAAECVTCDFYKNFSNSNALLATP
jgi:hypothetical protein